MSRPSRVPAGACSVATGPLRRQGPATGARAVPARLGRGRLRRRGRRLGHQEQDASLALDRRATRRAHHQRQLARAGAERRFGQDHPFAARVGAAAADLAPVLQQHHLGAGGGAPGGDEASGAPQPGHVEAWAGRVPGARPPPPAAAVHPPAAPAPAAGPRRPPRGPGAASPAERPARVPEPAMSRARALPAAAERWAWRRAASRSTRRRTGRGRWTARSRPDGSSRGSFLAR
jgi:hypothetical protein